MALRRWCNWGWDGAAQQQALAYAFEHGINSQPRRPHRCTGPEGQVQWVGTDAIADPKLGPVYPVRISLQATRTPNQVQGRSGEVAPGMSVTADIKTGERRLISYFLAPLLRAGQESLRER